MTTTKRIEIETGSYNERRYGKPWIANITLKDDELVYSFGKWIGTPGYSGILVLDAIGPIYARGQKDFRKPRGTENDLYLTETGERITKVRAYKLLKEIEEKSVLQEETT